MSTPKPLIPLKPINFEETARFVGEFSQQNDIPSLTYPKRNEGEGAAPTTTPRDALAKSVVMKRLPMVVPEYVMESLKQRAAQDKGASVRFVVLSALKAYGIEVHDEELVKDKRRDG